MFGEVWTVKGCPAWQKCHWSVRSIGRGWMAFLQSILIGHSVLVYNSLGLPLQRRIGILSIKACCRKLPKKLPACRLLLYFTEVLESSLVVGCCCIRSLAELTVLVGAVWDMKWIGVSDRPGWAILKESKVDWLASDVFLFLAFKDKKEKVSSRGTN